MGWNFWSSRRAFRSTPKFNRTRCATQITPSTPCSRARSAERSCSRSSQLSAQRGLACAVRRRSALDRELTLQCSSERFEFVTCREQLEFEITRAIDHDFHAVGEHVAAQALHQLTVPTVECDRE